MPKIERNKFLTKIHEGNVTIGIKTSVFDEITGISDPIRLSEISDIKEEPIVKIESDGIDYSIREGESSGQYLSRVNLEISFSGKKKEAYIYPEYMIINERKCLTNKFLEACDLSYDLLRSAIKSASFVNVETDLRCGISSYLSRIDDMMCYCVHPGKWVSIYDLQGLYSVKLGPRKLMGGTNLVSGMLTYKRDIVEEIGKLSKTNEFSLQTVNNEGISNMTKQFNFVFRQFSFFKNSKEYFFSPVINSELDQIINKCKKYLEEHKDVLTGRIQISTLVQQVRASRTAGMSQGILNLVDINGESFLLEARDLKPKPLYLAEIQTGKYGTSKTLKWNLEANPIKPIKK